MTKTTRENLPHLATTEIAIKGAQITSGAGSIAEKGEDISATKLPIAPTWLSPVTVIGAVIIMVNNMMIIRITAATDPGAADRITFVRCPIY
jgi:hypothetical protein